MTPDELLDELAAVATALAVAVEPAGRDSLLQSTVDAVRDHFDAAACSVALLDGDTLVYRVASGAGAEAIVGTRLGVGRGLAGWVVSSGMPLAVDDVTSDPRFAREVAERTGYVPRSILAMPLETERSVLGVLSVLDRASAGDPGAAQKDLALLALFAQQTALAIEGEQEVRRAGRVLLTALAAAGPDERRPGAPAGDLPALLRAAADRAAGPDQELLDLAVLLAGFARADPALRRLVVEAVGAFTSLAVRRAEQT